MMGDEFEQFFVDIVQLRSRVEHAESVTNSSTSGSDAPSKPLSYSISIVHDTRVVTLGLAGEVYK
jgi:hypothetical protein